MTHSTVFKLISITGLITALVSCASTTTVRAVDKNNSIDRNVKIYLNGSFQGKGEVIHSDTNVIGVTNVSLLKKGCHPIHHTFSRSEQLQVGPLSRTIFVLFPPLWVMGYNPLYSYEFYCEKLNS